MSAVIVCARVWRAAVLSLLMCASSLLVLLTGPVSAASASAPPPSTSNCQNTAPLDIPGNWTCTFDDEFNGTSLDTTKWTPQLSANSGYTTGSTSGWPCYVNNPNTIAESGGYLHLSVVQEATPINCAGYSTSFEAGMVTTDKLFDQAYGAFEVNAELPPSTVKGLQETFWLYPQNLTYGAWPHSGEIDFAEFYSQYPTLDVPYIHYTEGSSGDPNVTAYNCTINQGAFNTYDIDWQPGTLTIYLNGTACLVDHPNPGAPLTSPEPFNDPFFLALTQALGSGTDAYVPGSTQLPATTLIDWVRAWTANTDTYTVTYAGNGATGGTVPLDANSYTAGATVSVLANTGNLVNPGSTFDDWNTAANGSGTSYAPGATTSMPAANVTLYAIWTPDTYNVSYAGNGATAGTVPVDANSYTAGATVSVLANTGNLVNPGSTFDDWNTAANGSGTSYAPGSTLSMPAANVTLYAIWTPDSYTVTYAGNGATAGTVPVDANSYGAGATVSVSGNTGNLVNAGSAFDDWNTAANGSGTSYAPGSTLSMPAANVTLYAIWTPDSYTVTYAGNGATAGTVPVDANSYGAGATVSVLANTGNLVNAGSTFDDWNTAANGSGTSYAPGSTLSMPAANVTLYAIWTPDSYTVTYAGNGATAGTVPVDANSYGAGATVSVLANTGNLVNAGSTFDDWNTAANGSGTSYAPGATLSMPAANVTLYAIWTPDSYTVTYAGNGATAGTVPVDANSYGAGATVSVSGNTGNLVNAGSTFDDWNTAANGSGTSYAPGSTLSMPAANVTLYAIWTPDSYTVTYAGNGATAGTVPVDANSYGAGATVSVLANTGNLVNAGSTFDDWNTAANGSGTSYAPGATFSMSAANVTLYAIWTPDILSEHTTTGLSLSKTSVTYGADTSETFTVTVTGQPGDGYPEGTMSVYSSSTKLCSQTLVGKSSDSATATCSLTGMQLAAGSYSDVFATFTPSSASSSNSGYTYTSSTSTPAAGLSVTKDTTTTKVSESPTTVTRSNESAAVFTVTVATHNGEAVPNGEVVTVSVGSATCAVTINSGTGTCTIAKSALPKGLFSVSAAYGGDANLSGSSGTSATKLTVKN